VEGVVTDDQPDQLSIEEQVYAIKTWRYLRLAMVALVVGLFVSILYEWSRLDFDCFQTSISAYYYTPVHGFFVGALVSIGVCLFCLKGSTDAEDVLLNLAGMFAPVVALVPTSDTGSCASILATTHARHENIENNVIALLGVGAVGLVILAYLATKNRPTRPEAVGFAVAASVWVATTFIFVVDRGFFERVAHYTAAILMFICILIVVGCNALGYEPKPGARSRRNPYIGVGGAMVASLAVVGLAKLLGWDHAVIAIETALILLFAVFWSIQTKDLWHAGMR
jgi:hypothetical protein